MLVHLLVLVIWSIGKTPQIHKEILSFPRADKGWNRFSEVLYSANKQLWMSLRTGTMGIDEGHQHRREAKSTAPTATKRWRNEMESCPLVFLQGVSWNRYTPAQSALTFTYQSRLSSESYWDQWWRPTVTVQLWLASNGQQWSFIGELKLYILCTICRKYWQFSQSWLDEQWGELLQTSESIL